MPSPTDDLTAEVTAWLEENWDPDLTVEEWWDRLGRSGWAVPTWPVEWYGKGLSRAEGVRVQQAIGTFGALGAPGGLGTLLAGPTITVHGTDEQKRALPARHRHRQEGLVPAVQRAGRRAPTSPGSTRAPSSTATSGSSTGRRCGPRAGTGPTSACCSPAPTPTSPKHQGITYFARRHAPARRRDPPAARDHRPRDVQRGVPHRRARPERRRHRRPQQRLGGRQHHADVRAQRARRRRRRRQRRRRSRAPSAATSPAAPATSSAPATSPTAAVAGRRRRCRTSPRWPRPTARSTTPRSARTSMQLHTLNEIARYTNLRQRALARAGGEIPGLGNIAKLVDEPDPAAVPRPRRPDPRPVRARSTPTTPPTQEALVAATDGAVQPGDHRVDAVRAGARRSTAAPTRSSTTSSASGSSACPRSRAPTRASRSASSPRTADLAPISPRRLKGRPAACRSATGGTDRGRGGCVGRGRSSAHRRGRRRRRSRSFQGRDDGPAVGAAAAHRRPAPAHRTATSIDDHVDHDRPPRRRPPPRRPHRRRHRPRPGPAAPPAPPAPAPVEAAPTTAGARARVRRLGQRRHRRHERRPRRERSRRAVRQRPARGLRAGLGELDGAEPVAHPPGSRRACWPAPRSTPSPRTSSTAPASMSPGADGGGVDAVAAAP